MELETKWYIGTIHLVEWQMTGAIFERCDTDGNGKLSKAEFLKISGQRDMNGTIPITIS